MGKSIIGDLKIVSFPDQETGKPTILVDHNSNMYQLIFEFLSVMNSEENPKKRDFEIHIKAGDGNFTNRRFFKVVFLNYSPEQILKLCMYLEQKIEMYV